MRQQRGFTLLELMVAMAIFAMLAVAGWQVFDSVNRARERAQFHADNLAVLQYAYLQLQQDMGQIIPYQLPTTQDARTQDISVANSGNESSQDNAIEPEPFMSLDGERVSFVRFADPDPRYQSSTSMQHVEYIFADERLIRRQYTSLATGPDSVSLDSVLLEGVTAARWQAYLPEIATKFPDENNNNNNNTNSASGQMTNTASSQAEAKLLPKGIAVSFTYQDMPITWQWALAPQPFPRSSMQNTPNSKSDNSNDNGSNNDNTNGSNTANAGVGNANL
ncbi:type II secretion system minor pseudopilin GspJ [Psychrobacter sp. Pi2-51]|uniref:type II secretion system minor pseudopilin GspJ n=1 Tax=Psychrobacter sp. Pi2-51 TaxID=2774132 RepID=UPI001918FDB7|nr:type II secretion system minor pseudopilin GspJ [Psychrobacter sp. Pi2-51]